MDWQPEADRVEQERMNKILKREEMLAIAMTMVEAQIKSGVKLSEAVAKSLIQTPKIIEFIDAEAPLDD